MPGVWVFPGGGVDAGDGDGDEEAAHRACAVRELHEEAGIELPADAELLAWSRWITPDFVPVRFDTRFYVALAPAHSPPRPDGEETTEAAWIAPGRGARTPSGRRARPRLPDDQAPRIAASLSSSDEVLAAARDRVIEPVLPRVVGEGSELPRGPPGRPGYLTRRDRRQSLSQALRGDRGRRWAQLQARPGSILGFLGPNGAGKTTTLRIILGLAQPTVGQRHHRRPPVPLATDPTASVGAVLDTSGFHPGRRGRDHLRIIARAAGIPVSRVEEVLRLVELSLGGAHARQGVLPGNAAATQPGRGAPRRSRDAGARRARQRPRPAGDSVAPRLPALARRRRAARSWSPVTCCPRSHRPSTRSWSSIAGGFAPMRPSPSSTAIAEGVRPVRVRSPQADRLAELLGTAAPQWSPARAQGVATPRPEQWVISPPPTASRFTSSSPSASTHRSRRSSWSSLGMRRRKRHDRPDRVRVPQAAHHAHVLVALPRRRWRCPW